MKIKVFFSISFLVAIVWMIFVYGRVGGSLGERESKWIIKDMWGLVDFDSQQDETEEYQRINLSSLRNGSSKNQELITYVVRNGCQDGSERCYFIMMSASNLLIDGGEYDSGLRGMVEAMNRVDSKNICPIAYELSILNYKIKTLISDEPGSMRSRARVIINKIKRDGGLVTSLRTKSCIDLSKKSPEYFHAYTLLIAQVMGLAGGDFAKVGDYIRSSIQ